MSIGFWTASDSWAASLAASKSGSLNLRGRVDAEVLVPVRRADAVPELIGLADEGRDDVGLLNVLVDEVAVELGGQRVVGPGHFFRFGDGGGTNQQTNNECDAVRWNA